MEIIDTTVNGEAVKLMFLRAEVDALGNVGAVYTRVIEQKDGTIVATGPNHRSALLEPGDTIPNESQIIAAVCLAVHTKQRVADRIRRDEARVQKEVDDAKEKALSGERAKRKK